MDGFAGHSVGEARAAIVVEFGVAVAHLAVWPDQAVITAMRNDHFAEVFQGNSGSNAASEFVAVALLAHVVSATKIATGDRLAAFRD